jgi:outer membrane protein assembly factor BamB
MMSLVFPLLWLTFATVQGNIAPVPKPNPSTLPLPRPDRGRNHLKVLWERPLALRHRPVIYNGLVYVDTRDGVCSAIDLHTGKQKWQIALGDYLISDFPRYFLAGPEPRIVGDMVMTTLSDPAEGVVFALDARTGALRWRYHSRQQTSSLCGPIMTPAVPCGNDLVIFRTGAGMTALNRRDGRVVWITPFDPAAGGILFPSGCPTAKDNLLFMGADFGVARAFDIANGGRQVWETSTAGFSEQNTPTVKQRRIALSRCGPLFFGDHVFTADGSGFVYSLGYLTGNPLWKTDVGLTRQLIAPYPGDPANEITAITVKGIVALNAATGKVARSFEIPGGATSAIADAETILVNGNHLYGNGWVLLNRKDWRELARDNSFGCSFGGDSEQGICVLGGYPLPLKQEAALPTPLLRAYAFTP